MGRAAVVTRDADNVQALLNAYMAVTNEHLTTKYGAVYTTTRRASFLSGISGAVQLLANRLGTRSTIDDVLRELENLNAEVTALLAVNLAQMTSQLLLQSNSTDISSSPASPPPTT